jgi:hypothetical protein
MEQNVYLKQMIKYWPCFNNFQGKLAKCERNKTNF